jgi:hypothetical protein
LTTAHPKEASQVSERQTEKKQLHATQQPEDHIEASIQASFSTETANQSSSHSKSIQFSCQGSSSHAKVLMPSTNMIVLSCFSAETTN